MFRAYMLHVTVYGNSNISYSFCHVIKYNNNRIQDCDNDQYAINYSYYYQENYSDKNNYTTRHTLVKEN